MTAARSAAVQGDWLLIHVPQDKPPLTMYANAFALAFLGVHTDDAGVLHLDNHRGEFAGRLVSMASALVGWVVLSQMQAPALLLALAATNLAQSVTYFLITLRWKVSIHSAVAAGLAVLGGAVAGGPVWALILTVPLIAWSRVVLRRHTLAQTIVGAAIGSFFLAIALAIYGV